MHLFNHGRDMLACWIVGLPIACLGIPAALWVLGNGISTLTTVLDAIQNAVIS